MTVTIDMLDGRPIPKRGDILQTNLGSRRERTFIVLQVRGLKPTIGAPRAKVWAERWWEIEPELRMRLFTSAERNGGQQTVPFVRYKTRTTLMGLYNFQARFVPAIEAGTKTHTIRAVRAHPDNPPRAPRTTQEVVALWEPKLRSGARSMLSALVNRRGLPLTREQLGKIIEMEHTGGTFGTYLSDLRTAGLIVTTGNGVAANKEALFL